MILSDIRRYLQQRGQSTLADLCSHFDADPDAMRGMLQVWVRKGRVLKQAVNASCGSSCTKCDPSATEIYVWTGPGRLPAEKAGSVEKAGAE